MMSRIASLVVCLALLSPVLAAPAAAGPAEDAAEAYTRGNALLLEGSLDAAGEAFAEAVRLDPKNNDYRSEEAILGRVIKLRTELAGKADQSRWDRVAPGLRAYYYSKGMHGEALALDRQYHERVNSPQTTIMLAESMLLMNQDAEARQLLGTLAEEDQNDVSRMFLGIALARGGDIPQAQQIAAGIKLPAESMPALKVLHARLLAGIGADQGALTALQQAFESTPPNVLDGVKANVKGQRDFAALAASAEFAKVLETASKVKQSGCSGGSSCGACPSRTSCSTSEKSDDKKSCEGDDHQKTAADGGSR